MAINAGTAEVTIEAKVTPPTDMLLSAAYEYAAAAHATARSNGDHRTDAIYAALRAVDSARTV